MTKGSNAGERAKISAAVIGESPGDVGARPFVRNSDFEIGVALIIFEANVVSRFVFFNEVVFEYYGLLFGIGYDEINICYGGSQFSKFMGRRMRDEIRSYTIAQVISFSNIQNGTFAIPKEIYAGFVR